MSTQYRPNEKKSLIQTAHHNQALSIPNGFRFGFACDLDGVEISQLLSKIDQEYGFNRKDRDLEALKGAIQKDFWDKGGGFFKIQNREGAIVAVGGFSPKSDKNTIQIKWICVDKPYRSQGLGHWLFQQLIKKAASYNFKTMQVFISTHCKQAESICRKVGFQLKPKGKNSKNLKSNLYELCLSSLTSKHLAVIK